MDVGRWLYGACMDIDGTWRHSDGGTPSREPGSAGAHHEPHREPHREADVEVEFETTFETERTARQRALPWFGDVGQRRLASARVLVVGAGGLGAPIVQYLAASGIGRIDIIDDDVIERSNLARQVLFTAADLGREKAVTLATAAARLAPMGSVVGHVQRLDARSARLALAELSPAVVIDTTDEWSSRFAVADACRDAGVPLVWSTVIGTDGQITVFTGAPGDPAIDDLVDRATAAKHPVSCASEGVLGPVCGQVGAIAATETIKLLVGEGRSLAGRLAIIDGLRASTREVPLRARRPADEEPVRLGEVLEAVTRVAPDAPESPDVREPQEPRVTGVVPDAHVPAFAPGFDRRPQTVTIAELVDAPLGTVLVDAREAGAPPLPWPVPGLELIELVREPLESLAAAIDAGRLPRSIERASRVAVTCAFGPRARHAAAMLRAAGVLGVAVLDEGTAGLRAAASPPPSDSIPEASNG